LHARDLRLDRFRKERSGTPPRRSSVDSRFAHEGVSARATVGVLSDVAVPPCARRAGGWFRRSSGAIAGDGLARAGGSVVDARIPLSRIPPVWAPNLPGDHRVARPIVRLLVTSSWGSDVSRGRGRQERCPPPYRLLPTRPFSPRSPRATRVAYPVV